MLIIVSKESLTFQTQNLPSRIIPKYKRPFLQKRKKGNVNKRSQRFSQTSQTRNLHSKMVPESKRPFRRPFLQKRKKNSQRKNTIHPPNPKLTFQKDSGVQKAIRKKEKRTLATFSKKVSHPSPKLTF